MADPAAGLVLLGIVALIRLPDRRQAVGTGLAIALVGVRCHAGLLELVGPWPSPRGRAFGRGARQPR